MSLDKVRRALERHLAALEPPLPTAHENDNFKPPADGSPYQRADLLPAMPDNSMQGAGYFERGIFQVALLYPLGKGPSPAQQRAELIRNHFRRGTTLEYGGIYVIVTLTPMVSAAIANSAEGRFRVPVSITWQAQAFM